MKKTVFIVAAFCMIAFTSNVQAQTEKKQQISKEVKFEENNGEKTLTIKTIKNGNQTVEVYTGKDADTKLKELEKEKSGTTKTMFIDDDGKKHLKVEQKVVIREEIDKDE